ncbi:hypothetical protein [Sphingomonas sp.]|uniref:hypothetical protein n=1 Tax=Sphingomonas sp. TaxID=28214 RepID=UPI003CC5FD6E
MTAIALTGHWKHALERLVVRWWQPALLVTAVVLGTAARLLYDRGMPLWFDETFTGVIAGQVTVGGLWHWLRTELTGPFFYAPMWLWTRVAGVSTEALRLPSLLCTLAAPLFVWRRGHPDSTLRLGWAAVLLLWMPAAVLANDARPYALLVLLGTLQIAAFCALLRTPNRAAALRWAAVTALMGLTHYLSLVPGMVQGLLFVAVQRKAVLRLLPAAWPFLPLAAWMAIHLPFVIHVEARGMPQTTTLTPYVIAELPALLVGDGLFALLLGGAVAWSLLGRARSVRTGWPSPEALTATAALSAFGALFALGLVMPGLALRYFIPTIPGLLFAVSWWLAGALRRGEAAAVAFLLAMIVGSLGLSVSGWRDTAIDQRHAFGFDLASRWVGERPVRRVVFFWSDSTADLAPDLDVNLVDLGGFFFQRAGQHPAIDVLHVPVDAPAAAAVLARADQGGADAILWVGNAPSPDLLRRPGRLMRDPRWECRDFGAGLAMSLGCRRR